MMTEEQQEDPIITLVVCTRNRAAKLSSCFHYIRELKASFSWELIVVDNNSTDDTAAVVHEFIASLSIPAKCLFVTDPGNGAGRNAAIAVGRGQIFAFTDDDCYLDTHFLEGIRAVFENPRVGYMSGRILLFDPTDYCITVNESLQPLFFAGGDSVYRGSVQGANMAYRRAALVDAGGFDPNFGAGTRHAGEDWELAIRVSAKGWSGGYFPGPTVHHHHGRKRQQARKLMRYYNFGEGAIYAKCLLTDGLRKIGFLLLAKSLGRDFVKGFHPMHAVEVAYGLFRYAREFLFGRLLPSGENPISYAGLVQKYSRILHEQESRTSTEFATRDDERATQ